jgi:hypothetical protein
MSLDRVEDVARIPAAERDHAGKRPTVALAEDHLIAYSKPIQGEREPPQPVILVRIDPCLVKDYVGAKQV